jgi:hypothetical protein
VARNDTRNRRADDSNSGSNPNPSKVPGGATHRVGWGVLIAILIMVISYGIVICHGPGSAPATTATTTSRRSRQRAYHDVGAHRHPVDQQHHNRNSSPDHYPYPRRVAALEDQAVVTAEVINLPLSL